MSNRRFRRTALLWSGALTLAIALVGCSPLEITHVTTGDAGSPTTLQCNQSTVGHGVDVVNMKLTCQASGAASGDTSFQLHYTIKNGVGQTHSLNATCTGALVNGAGTCTQTYALVVPYDTGSATINGEFLPSHTLLGPLPLSQGNP